MFRCRSPRDPQSFWQPGNFRIGAGNAIDSEPNSKWSSRLLERIWPNKLPTLRPADSTREMFTARDRVLEFN